MKRLLVFAMAVMFLAVVGHNAYAMEQRGKSEGEGKRHEEVFKALHLTPEQQSKLQENRKMQRQKMEQLHIAIADRQKQLRESLSQPAATKESVAPLVNEINALQAQMTQNRVDGIMVVKQILTPEQFTQFQQLMEKRWQGKGEKGLGGGKHRFGKDSRWGHEESRW